MDDDVELPDAQGLEVVPRTVVPAGESEVIAMLQEQTRFADNDQMKGIAKQLLGAGYTVASVARRIGIRGPRSQTSFRRSMMEPIDAAKYWVKGFKTPQKLR